MCGVIAMFSAEKTGFIAQEREMFWAMMLLNSLRGAHSTGVVGIDHAGGADIMKTVGGPESFSSWKESDKFFSRIVTHYSAVLGHGRFATRGAINAPNAHPHESGNIILIHNGTMTNFDLVQTDYKKLNNTRRKFETDTELCAAIVDNDGVDELIKSYEGGYAFIIYNEEDQTITVTRNYERPLFMLRRDYRNTSFLSSEKSVFVYLMDKFNFKGEILEFSAFSKYTFELGEHGYKKEQMALTGGKYGQWRSSPPPNHGRRHMPHTPAGWSDDDFREAMQEGIEFRRAQQERPTEYPFRSDPPKDWEMDPITGIWTSRHNQELKVGMPKKEEVITKTEYNGHSFKLGQPVRFVVDAADERKLQGGGIGSFLSGSVISVPKIAVVGWWPHLFDYTGPNKRIAEGVIKTIIALDRSRAAYDMRFHVDDVRILGDEREAGKKGESSVLFLPAPNNNGSKFIKLADNSEIHEWRFDDVRKSGCACCGIAIGMDDHGGCTMTPAKDPSTGGPMLICPVCTTKGRLPDWVTQHGSENTLH